MVNPRTSAIAECVCLLHGEAGWKVDPILRYHTFGLQENRHEKCGRCICEGCCSCSYIEIIWGECGRDEDRKCWGKLWWVSEFWSIRYFLFIWNQNVTTIIPVSCRGLVGNLVILHWRSQVRSRRVHIERTKISDGFIPQLEIWFHHTCNKILLNDEKCSPV